MTKYTITHDLLPKQKPRSVYSTRKIFLYSQSQAFYLELERIGIIDRMKQVPQLGVIKVGKDLQKSRFDYAVMQMYLHQLAQETINDELKIRYGNELNPSNVFPFRGSIDLPEKFSIMELIQILILVLNMGHFHGTFTSSRAVILHAKRNKAFKKCLVESFPNEGSREIVKQCIEDCDESRLHHLNARLILDQRDQSLPSVRLAETILHSYMSDEVANDEEKRQYIFHLFKTIRDVAYVAYDLHVAGTPFHIDVLSREEMKVLLRELLSHFNDRASTRTLLQSMKKLLDDTLLR